MMSLPSHAGDGVVRATLVVARCHYRVMLVMLLPSHAGNRAIEATLAVACYRVLLVMVLPRRCWTWCDVATELCWRCHCQDDVGHGMMLLSSHTGDGTNEVTLIVA
jgi:hypothetical protein